MAALDGDSGVTFKLPPEMITPDIAFNCGCLKFPRNIKKDEWHHGGERCRECANLSVKKRRVITEALRRAQEGR